MPIFVDIETTGLNPRTDDVRLVQIADDDGAAVYDVWKQPHADNAAKRLMEAWKRKEIFVAHNAQFDLDFLYQKFPFLKPWSGPIFDTMVAYQILTNGMREMRMTKDGKKYLPIKNGLEDVAIRLRPKIPVFQQHDGFEPYEMDKTYQKPEWYQDLYFESEGERVIQYAGEDTAVLELIHPVLLEALENNPKLHDLFKLEMKILPIILEATRKGVLIDEDAASELACELDAEVAWLEEYVLKPQVPEDWVDDFKPRSPKEMSRYFNLPDATEDTFREYVKESKDALAEGVMEMKKRMKKQSSIEKQLIERIAPDGRIHPRFNQTGTETGRFSSSGPNLQNQDRGNDIRGLFIPAPGFKFVIADYSQLELRLAALFSRDEVMLEAYQNGRDLHGETQRRIFGDPSKMDKETQKKTRTLSKNINFGLVFGGGHYTLIKFAAKSGVEIGEEEAIEYRDAFRETYPGLYRWQRIQGNVKPKTVTTVKGRRRFIESGKAYCTRINHPVQGSAADGMKSAILRVRQSGILPLLNVHDELLCEVPENEAEDVARTVIDCMVMGMYSATEMDPNNPVVPIVVEADIGGSWADKS